MNAVVGFTTEANFKHRKPNFYEYILIYLKLPTQVSFDEDDTHRYEESDDLTIIIKQLIYHKILFYDIYQKVKNEWKAIAGLNCKSNNRRYQLYIRVSAARVKITSCQSSLMSIIDRLIKTNVKDDEYRIVQQVKGKWVPIAGNFDIEEHDKKEKRIPPLVECVL